ncbi:MAG: hypothetical protein D4R76_03765 [Methylococcus sp.]|nr:MAG: hypothetical protein D4R76_03765 [Methylococcus sp.]
MGPLDLSSPQAERARTAALKVTSPTKRDERQNGRVGFLSADEGADGSNSMDIDGYLLWL